MGRVLLAIAVASALAGATAIAGCSHSDPGDSDTTVPIQTKSQADWALPLDVYDAPTLANSYARKLLMRKCLAEASISFDVAPIDIDAAGPETANSAGRRLFTLDLAEKYGYHVAPTHRFDRALAIQIAEAPVPDAELEPRLECQAEANAALAPIDDLASALALSVDVSKDATVLEAVATWSECVKDQGVTPTTDPQLMPGDRLAQRFGVDDVVSLGTTKATPDEVRIAVIDASCRSSSGYSSALYEAEWDAQMQLLNEHSAELEKAFATNAAALSELRHLISELE